jgi:methanogenic corrinoid protein MtbC1
MKDLDRDRIMEHMTGHYEVLSDILENQGQQLLEPEELKLASDYLKQARQLTQAAVTDIPLSSSFQSGDYFEIRKSYLDALLIGDIKKAHQVIAEARNQKIPIEEIYEAIITVVMIEIGNLWHQNIITIDKEHFATSVTQTVLSSFYDEIFASKRKNKTLAACAVGSELHEMGVRMLSDLFEHKGWDTYYLGAALPAASVLHALSEHQPDLVALSVTMPQHLIECERLVKSIREKFPAMKIAVGGQAFKQTSDLWKRWEVDHYSQTAKSLVQWADQSV